MASQIDRLWPKNTIFPRVQQCRWEGMVLMEGFSAVPFWDIVVTQVFPGPSWSHSALAQDVEYHESTC